MGKTGSANGSFFGNVHLKGAEVTGGRSFPGVFS